MMEFNYSGANGVTGNSGSSGHSGFTGSPGSRGQDGGYGTNAMPGLKMDVQLTTNGMNIFADEFNQQKRNDKASLGDPNAALNLFSMGGRGGNGGSGGNGGCGGSGYNGSNATRSSSGTNGGPGGNGGDGGRGGDAGEGGRGGDITVSVNTPDMDLLMLVGDVSYKGGSGGCGGSGGSGGPGGSGGMGGSSYSWTETTNGETRSYSNSGGFSGPSGYRGRDGERGRDGRPGQDGSFCYIVEGQRYSSRYDLKINQVEKVFSLDGIIEPGEKMKITMMEIQNIGGMPTPAMQSIALSLANNQWVNFNPLDTILMRNGLPSGQTYLLEAPLKFTIKENLLPVVDTIFKQKANVDYRAKVERVNKEFQGVSLQNDFYELRYPVEMSNLQILRSITFSEESPFAISIWNRSCLPIGQQTEGKRLLNFRLMVMDTKQTVEFVAKNVIDFQKQSRNASQHGERALNQNNFIAPALNEQQNVIIEQVFISELAENSKTTISGTIKLKELDLPLYTKIAIQAKLDLGYINDPENTFQNIQTRNFHIQLTEGHTFRPNSDFLLVFNCDTSKELIDSFKEFARQFGSGVDLWNISNYQGFAFDFTVQPQNKSLSELYKNKVIIILANKYSTTTSQQTNTVTQMREAQIFKAAKQYGISAYIISDSTAKFSPFYLLNPKCKAEGSIETGPIVERFYEQIRSDKRDEKQAQGAISEQIRQRFEKDETFSFNSTYTYRFNDSVSCCSDPKAASVELKAKEILKNVEAIDPQYSYLVGWQYEPVILESKTFSKEYSLGWISVAESLRKDITQIITRQRPSISELNSLDQNDVFALLKLLPFERKLTYIERVLNNFENAKILLKAIISDLCDEYLTFLDYDQNTASLQNNLNKWSSLFIFPFNEKFDKFKNQPETTSKYNPPPMAMPQQFVPMPQPGSQDMQQIPQYGSQDMQQVPQPIFAENSNQQIGTVQVDVNPMNAQNININITIPEEQQQPIFQPLMPPQNQQFQNTAAPQEPTWLTIKNYFIATLIKFKAVMFKQLTFAQKYCCSCSSSKKVTKHCLGILENLLQSKFDVSSTEISQLTQTHIQALQNKNKHDVLMEFQKPYFIINKELNLRDEIILNNHLEQSKIKQFNQIPGFNFIEKEPIYIQQGSFIFTDESSQLINEEKRQQKIQRFEDLITFES